MLEKLIEYLKNLPEEEQKKLLEALEEKSEQVEQTEQVEESKEKTTEQAKEEEQRQEERATNEEGEEERKEQVEEVEQKKENEETEEVESETMQQQEESKAKEQTEEEEKEETGNAALLDAKIELQLYKLGIREDRLEAAKRLFKTEIHSLEDLNKLQTLIKEFPEWLQKKEQGKGFGVPVHSNGTSLTEEEKKLKSMGIDPKN